MALSRDFDEMAVVVDWLDACRNHNLGQLLDAYAADAALECACEGVSIRGRAELAAYWKPKLAGFAPVAFGIEEITPAGNGVLLDYLNFQGAPVRIHFVFDPGGKILRSRCEPAPR
jgi:ketosteroid isomerase-like protein